MAKRSIDTVKPVPRKYRKRKSPQYESINEWFRVSVVKIPSKGMKYGNGQYLEMKAIAGTMPHKKASLGSNEQLVPKLAV